MKFSNRKLGFLSLAVLAVAAVAVLVFASDASAAGVFTYDAHALLNDVVRASPVLIALRAEHSDIIAKATAKLAEAKDGLAADVLAKIEKDHADLLASAAAVQLKIDAEVKRENDTTMAAKPWAGAFFASAEAANISLKDLNEIVASSATHEVAKDKLIDMMAAAHNASLPKPNGGHTSVGLEATEKFVTGATRAIIAKVSMFNSGGKPDKEGERNEFTSLSLRELARTYLEMRGVRVSHDAMTMIGAAMQPIVMSGALSTSDFVNILANVANKAMLKGYEEAAETFDKWTGRGTLTDFKTTSRVDLGLFPSLAKVQEGAEYSYAKMGDRGVNLVLATYGKLFPITRQAIINDDLGAFTKVPGKMGTAAKRTIGDLVYAILTSNPNAPDGTALFHANHKNLLTGAGSVLSATSLDAGRTLMGRQVDPDNIKQGLNIRPKYWLGPITLQGQANQIFASQSEPGQDNPAVANRVANMAEVISEARLDVASTSQWYLAGDPAQFDTIEVDYLNGVEAPTLEQKDGWNVDGVEMKVRMDAAATLLDHRALVKSNAA